MQADIDKNVEIERCLGIFDAFFDHGFAFSDFRQVVLPKVSVQGAPGKAETRERLKEKLETLEGSDVLKVAATLKNSLESFIAFNSKVVYFLSYSPSEAESIVRNFKASLGQSNPFISAMPGLPGKNDVKENRYYPVAHAAEKGRQVLIFGVKRTIRESVDLPVSVLSDKYQELYSSVYQLRAHRLDEASSLEVVVVDTCTGVCEVRISNSRKLTAASLDESATSFFKAIKEYSGTNRLVGLKNFHPCIIPLYTEREDGSKVTQFYFETDDDGVKRENVRYNRSDLRDEKYHGAGSLAINYKFRVFAIRKHWNDEDDPSLNNVGVVVEGQSRILGDPQPQILKAKVLNCCDGHGYDFVMSKITPHMV